MVVLLCLSVIAPLAQAAPTTPTADFTDNGDGTVTHKTTGLTWKRCIEGWTWTGSSCTGTAQIYTWANAKAMTSTFAGKSDWRLPTVAELVTIFERDNINPAINTTIFPHSPGSYFWSASAYAESSDRSAWYVHFRNGINWGNKTDAFFVRLVRGGHPIDSSGLYTPTSDFVDNSDGTVTHKKTTLTWKRCAEGMTWTGSDCSGTVTTYTWTQAMALTATFGGKSDWRLPTQNELLTIVEWAKYTPAINTTIFPNTPSSSFSSSSIFWSASAHADGSGYGWSVAFDSGGDEINSYYAPLSKSVRLVRGGQSVASTPLVSSVTPSTATLGKPTAFTITGTNLVSGMGIYIPGCTPVAGQTLNVLNVTSSTSATYQCTPGTAGQQASEIKTALGGTVLYNFTVTVSAAAATYSITNITADPVKAVVSQPLTFTVTGSGLTTGMAWYLPDCVSSTGNQLLNVASSTLASFSCTPNATGLKSGYVKTAVGANGVVMTYFNITVGAAANQPPVAAFTATPTSGAAPLTVSLDASASSDADGSIASYAWTTSDNQTASGKTASFTFKKAGAITLTLTVADDKGATGSVSKTVTAAVAVAGPKVETTVVSGGISPGGKNYVKTGQFTTDNTLDVYPVVNIRPQDLGQKADIFVVVSLNGILYAHNGSSWVAWGGNLDSVPAMRAKTLDALTESIILFNGRLPKGTVTVWAGYRLRQADGTTTLLTDISNPVSVDIVSSWADSQTKSPGVEQLYVQYIAQGNRPTLAFLKAVWNRPGETVWIIMEEYSNHGLEAYQLPFDAASFALRAIPLVPFQKVADIVDVFRKSIQFTNISVKIAKGELTQDEACKQIADLIGEQIADVIYSSIGTGATKEQEQAVLKAIHALVTYTYNVAVAERKNSE